MSTDIVDRPRALGVARRVSLLIRISHVMSFLDSLTSLFRGQDAGARGRAGKRVQDVRRTLRVPQRMRSGFVWNEKLIAPRACMFKDLSSGGARVEILGEPIKASLLLDGVQLYFDSEKHEVPCSLAWMNGRMLGLKFQGRPRAPSRTYR